MLLCVLPSWASFKLLVVAVVVASLVVVVHAVMLLSIVVVHAVFDAVVCCLENAAKDKRAGPGSAHQGLLSCGWCALLSTGSIG